MFERSFERIGRFSEHNSGKVIIFWIVLLILLAPFSTLLFSETSYDIGSSIVPQNSMSSKASALQNQYFSNSNPSGGDPSLLIVTTGTSVNNQTSFGKLISAQNQVTNYLNSNGVKGTFTSVVNVENSTLSGVGLLALKLINGTYPLISEVNSQETLLNQSINSTLNMVYGIPAYYIKNYTSNGFNSSGAYNNTTEFLHKSSANPQISILYLNSFTKYENITLSAKPKPDNTTINYAIINATGNRSSPFVQNLTSMQSSSSPQILAISQSISSNFTYKEYLSQINATKYDNFVYNFEVPFISSQLGHNTTLMGFLANYLGITPTTLVSDVFSLHDYATPQEIKQLTDMIVSHGVIQYFYGSPLISINNNTILSFVSLLSNTSSVDKSTYLTLYNGDFSNYPAVPQPYVFHQFVGYDNTTVITILNTPSNLSKDTVLGIESIYSNLTSGLTSSHYYIAGSSALGNQIASETLDGMVRALTIGIVLSVIIVGIFFRSPLAAFLPLLIFSISAVISLSVNALIYKYIIHGSISFITPTLLLILLLGLSSDYVVYIMSRYKRELLNNNPDAIAVSSKWAGHAVFTSGITVSLSYVVLWISNVPIFSDSGITNAVGAFITILVANTLLIAIMSKTKERIFRLNKTTSARRIPGERGMDSVAKFVIKNRGKIVIIFVVSALLSGYLYMVTPTNMDFFDLVPPSGGIQAIKVVNSSFNGDVFDRGYIIMQFSSPIVQNSTYNATEMNMVTSVEKALLNNSEVTQVYGPTFPYGTYNAYNLSSIPYRYHNEYRSQINSYIGSDSHYVIIDFQLHTLAWLAPPSNFVNNLQKILPSASDVSYHIYIGGLTESLNNSYSYTLQSFVKMVPVLCIAIFVVLFIQLGSVFTPVRLIIMVLASVAISLSLSYILLYYIFGMPIIIFLPMFTVITLLAVGLDYDIFMVARVREEVSKGRSDREGIHTSIKENGGVIITLGSLLFATFGSLAFSGIGIMEEIGVGLALGVLIDTFISWPFFVPSIMLYLEKFNWWPSRFKHDTYDAVK